ncbi:MAG: YqaE/Pmp3 family membrane protein [Chlorobiaceae bacterium]
MDLRRLVLAFVLPPAAVTNKEVGTMMLTGILTVFGWLPGVAAALFMMYQEQRQVKAL